MARRPPNPQQYHVMGGMHHSIYWLQMISQSKFDPQVYLPFSDLAVHNAQLISIKLKRCKLDQFMKGVKQVIGRTMIYAQS